MATHYTVFVIQNVRDNRSVPETCSPTRLTQDQIAQYKKDGYTLVKQPVLSQDRFAQLKAILEEDMVRFGEESTAVVHFQDPRLMEFLLSDEILDLVEPLVGPNIGLWSSAIINKPPYTGKATPWHEDSSYWTGRISSMEGICTVWLALDRCTPENGCMRVIPGSQENGFSEYEDVDKSDNIFHSQIKPELIDESAAVYFNLEPNECSLHEARIIHGARANTSPLRRAGYTMRYFPTTCKVLREHPHNVNYKIWLARGKDLAGNDYAD
jgi:ectoine hydroxylase-related dioxygenase (phytanoyl-CoA dioxygenase family)